MDRHRADVMWQEAVAAIGPWVNAELNRDKKKHRKPFSLYEWTLTGLRKPVRAPKKQKRDPAELFAFIGQSLRALGGKDHVDSSG
jgi:hypothetical protein